MEDGKIIGFADITSLSEDADRPVPTAFTLVRFGRNKYTIDGKEYEFDLTPSNANRIVAEFNSRGKDLVIDYDHSTINKKEASSGNAPASGWIQELEVTPDGIQVKKCKWLARAKNLLKKGEYRYKSPVMHFDRITGEPVALLSVGLTNHPAIHGDNHLVAASDLSVNSNTNRRPITMNDSKLVDFATEVAKNLGELRGLFAKTVKQLFDGSKTDEEVRAFNDLKSNLNQLAFADDTGDAEMEAAVAEQPAEKVKQWIMDAIDTFDPDKDKDKIKMYQDSLAVIQDYISAMTEKPGASTEAAPEAGAAPLEGEETLSMNDIGSIIGFSDISDKGKIKLEIKALHDFKTGTERFLKSFNAKTLDDLAIRLVKTEVESRKKQDEAQEVIAFNDAKAAVDKIIDIIGEDKREWAIDFAKRDRKGFDAHIASIPPGMRPPTAKAFTDDGAGLSAPVGLKNKVTAFSDVQVKYAKMFGNDPEDVYGGSKADGKTETIREVKEKQFSGKF